MDWSLNQLVSSRSKISIEDFFTLGRYENNLEVWDSISEVLELNIVYVVNLNVKLVSSIRNSVDFTVTTKGYVV
jgi:hypothetical protein